MVNTCPVVFTKPLPRPIGKRNSNERDILLLLNSRPYGKHGPSGADFRHTKINQNSSRTYQFHFIGNHQNGV